MIVVPMQGSAIAAHHLEDGREAWQKELAAEAGVPDESIAESLGVGGSTVYRTKRRFVEGNLELERALREEPRPGAARMLEEPLPATTATGTVVVPPPTT